MKSLFCLLAALLLMGGGSASCLAQQPGPPALEGLLNSDEAQTPAASKEVDAGPKRPAGTVTRPKDGVQHPDLDKAWTDYDDAVAKVTESMKAAIAKQFDAATAKGDLDAAEKWQVIGEQFDKAGELPAKTEMKAAVSAAAAEYKNARDELTKAYDAVIKSLTMEKKIAEAKIVRNEQSGLQLGGAEELDEPKPDTPQGRRKPNENRDTALISRGITVATWKEIRGRDIPTQQVPLKTTTKATSSHPGNFGPNNAVDGDVVTEFAFFGAKGDLVVDFGGGVECSGLLLRARPKEEDVCTRGFVKIDDSAPFPVENFGGGRVLVIGLGRKQKVRRILFHSEQGQFNPGVAEILLVP